VGEIEKKLHSNTRSDTRWVARHRHRFTEGRKPWRRKIMKKRTYWGGKGQKKSGSGVLDPMNSRVQHRKEGRKRRLEQVGNGEKKNGKS